MLAVAELEVAHGDLQVVWGISFQVPANSVVALIGPNGAGKTTTLLSIMGLLPTMGGEVVFKDQSITHRPTDELVGAGLAMVPEDQSIFASLTVDDNLELGAFIARARPEKNRIKAEVFDTFPQLAIRRNQVAGTLSGGERKMLAISKALMADPELLILDEPSLGLAPLIVDRMFDVITKIRDRGLSILLVEQHVELALEVADHAHILEFGKIVAEGPANELIKDDRVRSAYLSL